MELTIFLIFRMANLIKIYIFVKPQLKKVDSNANRFRANNVCINKSNMKLTILSILLAFVLGCKQENDQFWVTYTMTQCADPWQNSPEYNRDKEGSIKKFLEGKSIEVLEINVRLDTTCAKSIQCSACTCSSCLVASVLIHENDLAAMEQFKFRRK